MDNAPLDATLHSGSCNKLELKPENMRDLMQEIICPHCTKAFKVDEAEYSEIVKQVRDSEFDKQLHDRLTLAEREKTSAIELVTAQFATELQQAAALKDAPIQELKGQIKTAEVSRLLAVTQALSAVEKERDALALSSGTY